MGCAERDWLDGAELAKWLGRAGLTSEAIIGESWARRVREWRQASRVSIYTVDPLLARLRVHPHELPDEVWTDRPRPSKRRSIEERRSVALAVERGEETNAAAAKRLGVSGETIRSWRRQFAREAGAKEKVAA